MRASRCQDCDSEFLGLAYLCPRCQKLEDEIYKNTPLMNLVDLEPWRWSKAAMRERLDVTGDVDE